MYCRILTITTYFAGLGAVVQHVAIIDGTLSSVRPFLAPILGIRALNCVKITHQHSNDDNTLNGILSTQFIFLPNKLYVGTFASKASLYIYFASHSGGP